MGGHVISEQAPWTGPMLAGLSGLGYDILNLLGPSDSSRPVAYGINENGAVAGTAYIDKNGYYGGDTGVIWSDISWWTNGLPSTVLPPTSYVLIYDGSRGHEMTMPVYGSALRAINKHGVAVGWREPGQQNVGTAAIYVDGAAMVNIPVDAIIPTRTIDVNDGDKICGTDGDGAFIYDRSTGTVRMTGLPGAEFGGASAINNLDEVVGWGDDRGFFEYAGGVKPLGRVIPCDLNDAGIVLGAQRRADGRIVPVTCDARSSTAAWTEVPLPPGFIGCEPRALNLSGHVVGSCWAGGGGARCAFVYIDGASYDLNLLIDAPGWHLETARDINDCGQICGNGTYKGQPAAFLLTPPLILPDLPPRYVRWPIGWPEDPPRPGEIALRDASIFIGLKQAATLIADAALRERVGMALSEASREIDADLADTIASREESAAAQLSRRRRGAAKAGRQNGMPAANLADEAIKQ